jgi:hypothetical protein
MTRAIHWISSVDPQNEREIDALQARMATFYRTNTSYYGDIDCAAPGPLVAAVAAAVLMDKTNAFRHSFNASRTLAGFGIGCGS